MPRPPLYLLALAAILHLTSKMAEAPTSSRTEVVGGLTLGEREFPSLPLASPSATASSGNEEKENNNNNDEKNEDKRKEERINHREMCLAEKERDREIHGEMHSGGDSFLI